MSAETGALATTPHPLGKPGGPGLFHDRSLSLPPYVQNIAHSLMTKRGMDKSKAIQVALGTVKNWASGQGNVKPEVRAAATAALAEWEKAKLKAHATPNKGTDLSQPMALIRAVLDPEEPEGDTGWGRTMELSQPMALLRNVLDGPEVINLAHEPVDAPAQKKDAKGKKGKKQDKQHQKGRHQLPPGATHWKHNWQPVDDQGRPVGPPQKDKSAAEIKDMVGHEDATKAAIAQAYQNKAKADAKTAASKAKTAAHKAQTAAKQATRKEQAAKRRAAAEAKRRAAAKLRAKKQAEAAAKRQAAAKAKAKAAKIKAHQKLVAQATKQALADKKAGHPLTPSQQKLIDAYEKQQRLLLDTLRNDVNLSQAATSGGGYEQATAPTVSSQDGPRGTVNRLTTDVPKRVLADAVKKAQKTRRKGRRKGGK